MPPHKKRLRVGTDCSGIEAPLVALTQMDIPFDHRFSSEIDGACRRVIRDNFHPVRLYTDITERNHTQLPTLDLYVAGFPCQAFSGLRNDALGLDDPRGTIFFECLATIRSTQPRCFLLENVRGLLSHDRGRTFEVILRSLGQLGNYHIVHRVLNTKDHGLPQNRPRLYIVGIRKDRLRNADEFQFPEPESLQTTVSDLMDGTVPPAAQQDLTPNMRAVLRNRLARKGVSQSTKENYIVNLGNAARGFGTAMKEICPCLMANAHRYYSTRYRRFLTGREHLRLQGFPDTFVTLPHERTTKKQAGNSMSVNVLIRIFQNLLPFCQDPLHQVHKNNRIPVRRRRVR